jgi:membrane protein required for beta-lactamase induction
MLYVLDWLPTRVLVLTVALVSQFDDVLLAWRMARVQHPMSNTHILKAACSAAIGLPLPGRHEQWGRVEYLQAFRTLMQKCAVAWLVLVAVLAVLSAVPRLAA